MMIILGIESTAHTFGIGIIAGEGLKQKILCNVKDCFVSKKGGMIPGKVADHHVEVCDKVLSDALNKAGVSLQDIDLISFSQSPGLGHCLRVGAMFARTLAVKYNKPLIGVNHCIAHLEIGRLLTKAKDPILLYVSGANTQVIAYEAGRYRIFGETLDIGIGNLLDSFARILVLEFPGGPKIEELALNTQNKNKGRKKNKTEFITLPYSVKGMDINFGGTLTLLKNMVKSDKFGEEYTQEDLCYSLQETIFAMMIEISERALAHTGKKELLLGGGVACNKRLQEMAKTMCKERGAECFILENQFNVDNGVMIAWLGYQQYTAGERMDLKDAIIKPYLRTDEIEILFR